MLRPRIIPCLLLSNGGLIKTVKFGDSKYVGDPINVVKILNEKEVDELILLDINKSTNSKEIDFDLIEKIAGECRMPLCYGGGVSKIDDFVRLIKLGVEKIAINTSLLNNFELIKRAAEAVGSQSIVAVLDIKKDNGKYQIFKNNGTINTSLEIKDFLKVLDQNYLGEIVINSIDRDGTMLGYDFELLESLLPYVNTPLTFMGGASNLENISDLFYKFPNVGAGVGSLFVFKGKFKAVLVNYPYGEDKLNIINYKIKK